MDIAIQATTEMQVALSKGKQAEWVLEDIKSSFNYIQKAMVISKLTGHKEYKGLIQYTYWSFQPSKAIILWDGEIRGTTTIKSGAP